MTAFAKGVVVSLLPACLLAGGTILQIQVIEGEGAVIAAGARMTRGLAVKITDDLGKPVPGALVSFRLAEDGPSGVFLSGLATEIVAAGEDGVAWLPTVRWNRVPGPVRIRVVAVKEQSRAGTVVPLYLSAGGNGADGSPGDQPRASLRTPPKRSKKWIMLGLVAAGAAGVGFSTGWASGPRREPASGPEPPRVGPPVISLGRP